MTRGATESERSPRTSGGARRACLGVLGGMGPLASAEFLKTIYEQSVCAREQDAPSIVLHSDPSIPDRTEALLNGRADVLLERLIDALDALRRQGVSRIVICCVTIHYLLPRLPPASRGDIVSLLDVIFASVRQSAERHLLLCTTGTRRLGIFESHPEWAAARDRLVLPGAEDQELIHRVIYQTKTNGDASVLTANVERLLRKYDVHSFVAGCTEIHFAAKRAAALAAPGSYGCVDPLLIVARDLAEGRL